MQSAVLRSHVVRLSVCPSVCLSVTLVNQDHIGRKSWKLIARTLSPSPSLFGAKRSYRPYLFPVEHGEILGRLEVGWEKNGAPEHKSGNISVKRVQIEEKLRWGAYRNSPLLFRTVPSPTPYGLPFPKVGVCTPPKIPIAIISGTG